MADELQIIQPNIVTTAKYDYTSMQKNILYQVVSQLQEKMTADKMNRDLFGSYYLDVPIAEIAGNKNHTKVYEAAEELIGKKFQYNWKKENGKEGRTTSGLVSSVTHEKNAKHIRINIPEEIVPVLLYIGEGFTKYQKTIAITLKSVHAKRMYELCNRWRDLGGFRCSLDEFRDMMSLEDKYPKLSMLKARVLDAAKKELEERADVYFEYSLEKKDSRQFNLVTFKIFQRGIEKEQEILRDDKMLVIYNMLSISYPNTKNSKAKDLTELIAEHEDSGKIYLRFNALRNELKEGKKKREDLVKLLPHILKEDFGITQ